MGGDSERGKRIASTPALRWIAISSGWMRGSSRGLRRMAVAALPDQPHGRSASETISSQTIVRSRTVGPRTRKPRRRSTSRPSLVRTLWETALIDGTHAIR